MNSLPCQQVDQLKFWHSIRKQPRNSSNTCSEQINFWFSLTTGNLKQNFNCTSTGVKGSTYSSAEKGWTIMEHQRPHKDMRTERKSLTMKQGNCSWIKNSDFGIFHSQYSYKVFTQYLKSTLLLTYCFSLADISK